MTPDILYLEDDLDFAFLTESALQEVNSKLSMEVIDNGKDAITVLQKFSNNKSKPRIILLDLNLPGLSGIDIVKIIREIPNLKYVPVIFFSTSDNPKDVKLSLEFGANAFLNKPCGYTNLKECLQSMCDFWMTKHLHID